MTNDVDSKHQEFPWPKEENHLFISAEDAENNAWLKWRRADERWWAYAEGYRKAADILVGRVREREAESEQDFLGYPVGFLYRHYLELRLKSLIMIGAELQRERHKFPHGHDVQQLWREARAALEQVWPNGPKADLDNVESCIREFAAIDPIGEAFRYPSTKEGKETLPDLTHINLRSLSEVMARLAGLLDGALDGMWAILDLRDEAKGYLP